MPRAQGCAGAAHVQGSTGRKPLLRFLHTRRSWRYMPRAQGCAGAAHVQGSTGLGREVAKSISVFQMTGKIHDHRHAETCNLNRRPR